MKTATTCERCTYAEHCPAYDKRMLYGFCQGFVDKDDRSNEPFGDEDPRKAEED